LIGEAGVGVDAGVDTTGELTIGDDTAAGAATGCATEACGVGAAIGVFPLSCVGTTLFEEASGTTVIFPDRSAETEDCATGAPTALLTPMVFSTAAPVVRAVIPMKKANKTLVFAGFILFTTELPIKMVQLRINNKKTELLAETQLGYIW
jgi:hypothetical protein